jgi:xanthine dehydrogenase accessory factor
MSSPYERMAELLAANRAFALATVVRTLGSTPQVVGAKLVVTADESERPFGTLGGGCVEADAVLAAREVLATGGRSVREYRLTEELAWNTGLVCGGTMWILAEPGESAFRFDGRDGLIAAYEAATGGIPVAFVTRLDRDRQQASFVARGLVTADGELAGSVGDASTNARATALALEQMRHGTPRVVPLDDRSDLLIEPVTTRPRLVVAGGGHVAKALARQAQLLDFDVTILEDRPEFADPERFGGADVREGDVPESIASFEYGWQTYLVIATRGHKLDADCVMAAVRTNVPYIGVLGSRRKTVLLADMLRDAGVAQERIDTIHAPVGLDLGGRTPAEIALAVLAEITQRRYGGSGKPLRASAPNSAAIRGTTPADHVVPSS